MNLSKNLKEIWPKQSNACFEKKFEIVITFPQNVRNSSIVGCGNIGGDSGGDVGGNGGGDGGSGGGRGGYVSGCGDGCVVGMVVMVK